MDFIDLFQYTDYRSYLRKEFAGTGERRGRRTLLAKKLRCQTSFLSLVFTDRAHLSLEHSLGTTDFLGHRESEKRYFMLLVQKGKAGSRELERFFDEQLEQIRTQRENIKERIGIKTELSTEDQMKYYSSWFYSAIHILSALPEHNSIEMISKTLKLEISVVKTALEFLEERGFVTRKNGALNIGARRIHLPKDSAMLPRHHSNWRMKAIEAVDHEKKDDLHYSAVLGISRKDLKILKEKILELLQTFEPVIQNSKEEIPVIFLADLFEL